ncbi:alanine--tRNA ligase [Candidatus Falkowbacteria bacterium RIFOXYC2_FULL_48_21]|uniref:Alanine--tRNA ligase n=1 Tax=Candidatus Falkowbacteria bacterium RIFOXYC2_FULL_48_21 TaxID=1798005 RepID=A0A1F5T740_9BACT|nr:MAG: alanine--tRNA ligase [Candidatus Falkowbacteria bacterium RIFOXYC2_FULL_48_21]
MTISELRSKYLEFFRQKKHAIIPSASLIPENDATVLFTTAGMHPLVPYLLGEKHPSGQRLSDAQKCIRTGDIDDVGDNRHLTFFEMLGNWSFGDYFKKEAIEWSFEFLTSKKWLGLDPKRLYVSVFRGNEEAPLDEESINLWKKQFESVGIDAAVAEDGVWKHESVRIFALGKDDNWWGLASGGPCGPCTEMFYDTAPERGFEKGKTHEQLVADARFFEVWNDVFMEYKRLPDGKLEKLTAPNVDTGMGLERTTAVLNGEKEVFDIKEFQELFAVITELSGKQYHDNQKAFRIIADHARAATFILGDEKAIEPSNVDQGYVLRRLIRRAVRYGKALGINEAFTFKLAEVVVNQMSGVYAELKKNKEFIITQLVREEEKFSATLERGLGEFNKIIGKEKAAVISGFDAFVLYSSYGFPLEMTSELAKERGRQVDEVAFNEEMQKHQALSRAGAEQKFKGGLADTSEQTVKYHTATHLLLAALRQLFGAEIYQKGSNITTERLRFDFNFPEKMTADQLKQVEELVNEKIKENIPVEMTEMPKDEALRIAKVSFDPAKYGDVVKVYRIGEFSAELCGGPHVGRTGELGRFKIVKEEASSAGVRRIKAALE